MKKILYHPKAGTTGFFFMKNVPKEPNLDDRPWYKETGYLDHSKWYERDIKSCKEEAIKNGEIVNPELAGFNISKVNGLVTHRPNKKAKMLNLVKDGDIFDLPEGLNGIKVNNIQDPCKQCGETARQQRNGCNITSCYKGRNDYNRTAIYLVPIVTKTIEEQSFVDHINKVPIINELAKSMFEKEETQDELWLSVYKTITAYRPGNFSDIEIKMLLSKFTIKRKSK